jgi:hypothetical protein
MSKGIDCLNHGGSAGATGTLALGSSSWSVGGERIVNFVTTRDVAAGEQVRALAGTGQPATHGALICGLCGCSVISPGC